MKKTLGFAAILLLLSACVPRAQEPEKTIENGKEVVINRLEPYKIVCSQRETY